MASPLMDDAPSTAAAAEYPDDGHIYVCVRVRDVPQQTACLTNSSSAVVNANPTRVSTLARKSTVKEAQRVCVSLVENIVVMHDPKSIEDAAAVAKDGNNVVQMLTDRATNAGRPRASRKTTSNNTITSVGTRTASRRTTTALAPRQPLLPTGTANYYEVDHCIASMEQEQLLQMPLIRTSDFLQPPSHGSQEDVYRRTAMHAVKAAVDGINSCVFAYGQTGSGKTYTLFGDTANMRRDPGVVPRTIDDLFGQLESVKASYRGDATTDYGYTVQLSFFEIYQNEVYCLFSRQGPLHVQFQRDPAGKKETMIIHDLQQQAVTSAEKAYPLVEMGLRRRQTAETGMNARSSRSHAILQLRVTQIRMNRDTRESVEHQATINLVDLAGSERQKTANTDGKTREEGIQINQSLATLARVINDIASGAKFVNYRDSLLTMVLKDNLGGNSKTFMIANISPIAFSFAESCATLTYAKDVRKIRNRPMVNKTFQTRANLLEQNARLKQENEKLKEQMEAVVRNMRSGNVLPEGDGMTLTARFSATPGGEDFDSTLRVAGVASSGRQGALTGQWAIPPDISMIGYETFLSATSAGLTAPLLVTSHRKYTNVAGIGGSCVEGGVVRVSALVQDTMNFALQRVLDGVKTGDSARHAKMQALEEIADKDSGARHTVILMDDEEESEDAAAAATSTQHPVNVSDASAELGVLRLERAALRSCDQRYFVHFLPPTTKQGVARLIDVQINGRSLGAKNKRELHHGDVICAYLEGGKSDAAAGQLQTQSLVSFHFVDLNALSRNTTVQPGCGTTLGQIAVSVDIPADLEDLTLENIKQLQRDNAKLLDMVRQQADTIDYQHARASMSQANAHVELTRCVSPMLGGSKSVSPDPRAVLDNSPCAAKPVTPQARTTVVEAFRRTSERGGFRGGSTMPADLEAEELLRRAAAQSESQQRLDSAVRENETLHRTVVSRNATLDALAKRLAELEADDSIGGHGVGSVSSMASSPSSAADSSESSANASSTSVSLSPSALRDDKDATVRMQKDPSAETTKGEVQQEKKDTQKNEESQKEEEASEVVGDGKRRVVYENTEGTRERYQAVVRERVQYDRIVELEALVRELQERIAELESRLRIATDETLEEQMLREQAEAERDAVVDELTDLRRDNAALEAFLAKDEQVLRDAAHLTEEEVARMTSLLADRITALKAMARMWKQRTMKYIAMGYGANGSADHLGGLDAIPWDDLRSAETVAIVKRRLDAARDDQEHGRHEADGNEDCDSSRNSFHSSETAPPRRMHGCTAEMLRTMEEFEKETAVENVRALEYALLAFEQENQRLLDEIRRIQAELQRYKDLIDRLRAEKANKEQELAAATGATEEEQTHLKKLLRDTNAQLQEAEENLRSTQSRLDTAVAQCDTNKRKAVKNNELLLAQQKRTIEELEAALQQARAEYQVKDDELRNLTHYVEGRDGMGEDTAAKGYELRSRIEEMVLETTGAEGGAAGYSVFPTGYEFSEEMVALIRICLRILLDRLKMELYVLNSQSIHRFGLLIHAVKARTEAHFHTFMHQLRDAVSQMSGRVVRPGGKWGLSEADVLSNLVDHRRRQVGDALYGLLIWYDHWDSAPKTEHIAYMELIRNADRILQMARLVRRESLLNTNATSTALLPVPGKRGASEKPLVAEGGERQLDKTVLASSKILSRLNSQTRQSNLARAVNEFAATPSRNTGFGREDSSFTRLQSGTRGAGGGAGVEGTPFRRSATVTALALSQSMIPFGRTATGTRTVATGQPQTPPPATSPVSVPPPSHAGEQSPAFTRCPSGPPRPSAIASPARNTTQLPPVGPSSYTPMRPTKLHMGDNTAPAAAGSSPAPMSTPASAAALAQVAADARTNYTRMASSGVLPVSDADVAYVANTDVAEAMSINNYNFSRRMSATAADSNDFGVRRPSNLFSRCQTSVPVQSTPLRRQNSAVPIMSQHRTKGEISPRRTQSRNSSGGSRVSGAVGHPRAPLKTEAFMRSRTQFHPPPPAMTATQGAAAPAMMSMRRSGSSSDPRPSRRRSSTLQTPVVKAPPARLSTSSSRSSGPFYNPAVLQALRERSTSDANCNAPTTIVRKSTGLTSGTKIKATMPSAQLKKTPSSTLRRMNSGVAASVTVAHSPKSVPATKSTNVTPEPLAKAASTSPPPPQVPRLNLAGVASKQ